MFYDSHGRLAPIEMIHEIGTSSLIDIFNLIMNYTLKKKKKKLQSTSPVYLIKELMH